MYVMTANIFITYGPTKFLRGYLDGLIVWLLILVILKLTDFNIRQIRYLSPLKKSVITVFCTIPLPISVLFVLLTNYIWYSYNVSEDILFRIPSQFFLYIWLSQIFYVIGLGVWIELLSNWKQLTKVMQYISILKFVFLLGGGIFLYSWLFP